MTDGAEIVMCASSGRPYTDCPCDHCERARAFNARHAAMFRGPRPVVRQRCARPAPPQRQRSPRKQVVQSDVKNPVVHPDRRLPAEHEFDDNTWIPTAPEPPLPAGAVTAAEFGQEAFQASGAAASQNAKLLEFFLLPHNFGLWFKATFLEELSGATRMNNRAVDLRKELVGRGLYIDNYMIKPNETAAVSSHYRICHIAEALCLSAVKKQELLNDN